MIEERQADPVHVRRRMARDHASSDCDAVDWPSWSQRHYHGLHDARDGNTLVGIDPDRAGEPT